MPSITAAIKITYRDIGKDGAFVYLKLLLCHTEKADILKASIGRAMPAKMVIEIRKQPFAKRLL